MKYWVILLITGICLEMAGISLSDDFTRGKEWNVEGKGSFRGILPAGWQPDYPHWNHCVARGELINEGTENFLRIHVDKIDSQRIQLARPIPLLSKEKHYRLTLQYRNRLNDRAELLIRHRSAPFRTFWTVKLPVTQEWTQLTFYPELSRQPEWKDMSLYLYFGATGTFDLVSLRLEECSAEEAQGGRAKIFRPAADTPNFFRNSRLSLGPQSGWSFKRDLTPEWKVSRDAGPSGSPYLTFRSNTLYTEPFQVAEPGKEHFISFFYKGEGKVTVPWRDVTLEKSGDWRRMVLPAVLGEADRGFTLAFHTDKELSLDGFGVSPRRSGEYVSAGTCEVALALPESDTSRVRIQFEDEPAELTALLTGQPDGVELAVTVENLYGKKSSFQLKPEAAEVKIPYLRFPETPLGQFRVEVTAMLGGKAVSPVNELVVTRLVRPKYQGRFAPDSYFGIHALANADTLKILKSGGVNAVRLHDAGTNFIGWSYLEPEKGVWHFRDREIAVYRDHHFTIFGGFSTAPAWATGIDAIQDWEKGNWQQVYRYRYAAPRNPEDFARAVKHIASHYREVIREYFVWNEPWSAGFFYPGYDEKGEKRKFDDPAKAYFELQKTAFEAARSVDPGIRVSGFNTVDGHLGEKWNRQLLALGADRYCGIVDYHLYLDRFTGFPGDATGNTVAELKKSVNWSPEQKIYMSEGQGASKSSMNEALGDYTGLYRATIPWESRDDNRELAELQVRYLATLIAAGTDKIYLYSAHTYTQLIQQPNFVALLQADGFAHPQLAAHSALALRIDGKKFIGSHSKGGAEIYLFEGDGESAAVVMPRRDRKTEKLTCSAPGAKAADLFGNPLSFPTDGNNRLWYLTAPVSAARLAAGIGL